MAKQTINPNAVQPLGLPNSGTATEMGDSWQAAVTKLSANFTEIYAGLPLPVGGGSGTYKAGGNIVGSTVVGPVGSSATNTTQTLASYVLPASSINAAGQELNVTAWGTVAANAAPKTIALNLGGAFVTTGTQTGNGYSWQLNGVYMRNAASTQNAFFSGVGSGGIVTQKNQADTAVETGTILLSCTMADASAAQSNVLLYGFTVAYFP